MIAYILLLGIIYLLSILYRLPHSFFGDTVRFTCPFLAIWLLWNYLHSSKQVQNIKANRPISVINPTEAQLLRNYHLQQAKHNRLISQLHNQQQDILDHVELYSHEIKNSLTSLQAAAENNQHVDSSLVLTAVHQANDHLTLLLGEERLSMTHHDFAFEWINLKTLITEILKQNSALFISQQLLPQLQNIDKIKVLSDRKWLRFCIYQLLSNAIKYSPKGSMITFQWQNDSLKIIDFGVGIASEDLPRIYENGFSGKNGHHTTASTGMGLYLVQKVTEQLNFKLSISSVKSQGTTASLFFPENNIKITD